MSKVISGYFDDAHRGLQRQQTDGRLGSSSSNVQLPPLRSGSPPGLDGGGGGGGVGGGSGSWDKGILKSSSMSALELSQDQLANGVQLQRHQQTMEENMKLARRIRQLQDQLSITTAKKEAFKAQAQRLEKEFRKGREQTDSLSKELLEARREAGQCTKEAQESLSMMTEMRKAHIMEVRLLQRGLAQRGGDAASRNKVNEVADLVDKVGRAVVQRDEAIRDKTKMQSQFTKAVTDCRNLADEAARLKRSNRELTASLKEAQRKAKFNVPKAKGGNRLEADSDEEFEHELATFEKRFEILEEGPAGLDILASNLSKDKQELEKRIKKQQETMRMLNQSIEDWKTVNAEKDEQIKELNLKVEKMLQDQALLNEQIAQKRREIELQVEEEKAALERRIEELKGEVDLAQQQAVGLEKVSSRLTSELVKVHGQYGTLSPDAPADAPADASAEAAVAADNEAGRKPAAGGDGELPQKYDKYIAKTGEALNIEINRSAEGAVELHVVEVDSGEEMRMPVDDSLKAELDAQDPWGPSFCSRIGVSSGPPRKIVVSSIVAEHEISLPASEAGDEQKIHMTVFKYDPRRYFFSGVQMDTGNLVDCIVMEDALTPELCTKIDACASNDALYELLTGGLSFTKTGDGVSLNFSAATAVNAS